MKLIANSGRERVIDRLGEERGQPVDALTGSLSVFAAEAVFTELKRPPRRVLLGSDKDEAALGGTAADRLQRNRLRVRSQCAALGAGLADCEIREASLPPSQAVLLGTAFAL